MSQTERINLPETTMAERLAARRERAAAAPEAAKPDAVPALPDGMVDRLMARRERQEATEKQRGDGEGEGSLGKQVAREPLFVGLGIRGHHHAGSHDHEAPPVKEQDPMDRPARRPVGAREPGAGVPQPERARRRRL